MARIATSVEESKRLLELGIDPKSADMYWIHVQREGFNDWWKVETIQGAFKPRSMNIPAWSLGELFDIAWELDPNQVLSFQKGEKMDLIAIMVDFIEMLVREVNTKGLEDRK